MGHKDLKDGNPTLLRVNPGFAGGPLTFPVTGPVGEVQGFALAPDEIPTQELVDRVGVKFEAFYDGLPADEQVVVRTLLAQAAELTEETWPA